jgi:parallel beta-helix repeat protein
MVWDAGAAVHCPEEEAMHCKRTLRTLITSVLITGLAVQITTAAPATAAPPMLVPIGSCVTIAVSGGYILTKNLGPVATSCITITAPNVVLNLNTFTITGTGPGAAHGVGITASATNARVGNGRITGFRFGVDDRGSKARLSKLVVYANLQAGVYLLGTAGGTVTNSSFRGNRFGILMAKTSSGIATGNTILTSGAYGIWMKSSSHFQILSNHIQYSGKIGIYVGCSSAGISHALTCPLSSAGFIESNKPVSQGHMGIAIDTGNTSIRVTANTAKSNTVDDLYDANPGCGTNIWSADIYTTHNQACVT